MSFFDHVRYGLREGYPLCCVLRWSWTWKRDRRRMQARERGIRHCDSGNYVPCGVFHRAAWTLDEYRMWLKGLA